MQDRAELPRSELRLYDAEGSRRADECAREVLKLTGLELMRRAARAAFTAVVDAFPSLTALSIWCGKGNNAGDALLLAVMARQMGIEVEVVALESSKKFTSDAALALGEAQVAGVKLIPFTEDLEIHGDVIVDGLLGTGFHGQLRPAYARAIGQINAAHQPVVSVDVPSGLNVSTGGVAEQAVRADHTVTFITHKIGVQTGAGKDHAGQVEFADLGVPSGEYPTPQALRLMAQPAALMPLDKQTYKHNQGHVLVVGGDHGMSGAVALASEAALRAGAGLVTVATRTAHANLIVGRSPELMVVDAVVDDPAWQSRLDSADVIVLGPGLGREAWGAQLYRAIELSGKPTVLDADGLFHLANGGAWAGGPLYMTPHSGEAARLLSVSTTALEQDRLASCQTLATQFDATVALKGPGTVVGGHGLSVPRICVHGNPGMASAGMGDALAGLAGGLLGGASRADVSPSALAGLFAQAVAMHSAAADYASLDVGQRSLLARDVIAALPYVMQSA